MDYEPSSDTVIVYGYGDTIRYSTEGKYVETINCAKDDMMIFPFYNLAVAQSLGGEKLPVTERRELDDILQSSVISKAALSRNGKYYYLATDSGFDIVRVSDKKIISHTGIEFGAQDIKEVFPNFVALSTWNGVKLFEITEEDGD